MSINNLKIVMPTAQEVEDILVKLHDATKQGPKDFERVADEHSELIERLSMQNKLFLAAFIRLTQAVGIAPSSELSPAQPSPELSPAQPSPELSPAQPSPELSPAQSPMSPEQLFKKDFTSASIDSKTQSRSNASIDSKTQSRSNASIDSKTQSRSYTGSTTREGDTSTYATAYTETRITKKPKFTQYAP